uniref:NADH-ubiquinone oxidoreductase chain 2 n=1 Tax=Namalycastis abiuma TaxID=862681 RepID=A0A342K7Y9_9ANNE|nr:NADH dehydrogenase subunit 2 [Namalycastis abiuma]AMY15508.1 NADH dehydrogenase subunit 2 [Namalycastis abiuma]
MLGTIMAISSTNWLYVWMGLELNLLSFIPLMSKTNNLQETESTVKYFITQATGSGLLLLSAFTMNSHQLSIINPLAFNTFMMMSLFLKLGAAPMHWWLPQVMAGLPWLNCLILTTWQKIAPLCLLLTTMSPHTNKLPLMMCMLGAVVGGVGGMNQSHLRTMLAYSSIGHLAWMLTALMIISSSMLIIYFMVYSTINLMIMSSMHFASQLHSTMNQSIMNTSHITFMSLTILLFSLGGLPPLLGFTPKWLMLISLTNKTMFTPLFFLISGSLLNLFYYLSMTFNFLLSSYSKRLTAPQVPTYMMPLTMIMGGLSSLIVIM